jgi:hypothetical protein
MTPSLLSSPLLTPPTSTRICPGPIRDAWPKRAPHAPAAHTISLMRGGGWASRLHIASPLPCKPYFLLLAKKTPCPKQQQPSFLRPPSSSCSARHAAAVPPPASRGTRTALLFAAVRCAVQRLHCADTAHTRLFNSPLFAPLPPKKTPHHTATKSFTSQHSLAHAHTHTPASLLPLLPFTGSSHQCS